MTKFKFKKKYGQNFLDNKEIIDKIVSSITPNENDLIIEIGPGAGAITKKLKKYNTQLLAFEIDTDVQKFLNALEDEKTHIIYEDFLTADINLIIKNYKYNNLYIIGNLPYYITTPIIERIIDQSLNPKEIVIMVQKEVADRFLATPKHKEYGYMTVLLNYHYNINKIVDVDRSYFTPAPNVYSTVLKLTTKKSLLVDYNKFKNLIKDAFQFKRKTINNNLKKYDINQVEQVLTTNGYTLQNRAEDIDLKTFIDLTNKL